MDTNRIDLAIGAQIRRQRNALRMSMADLSAKIGVAEFEVAQFENGTKRVDARVLARICKLFGVGVGQFFDTFELPVNGQTRSDAI